MRKLIALTAAAPLALLAACGDADTVETTNDVDTAEMDTGTPATAESTGPAAATSLADAGDYSGEYSYTAPDGSSQNLTLNSADDTYEYTAPDGTKKTGTYERNADGYRIRIVDFYGSPAWFSVSNDSLVRLMQDVELNAETDFESEDEGFQDRAVFSRAPEPGSSVTPD